MDVVLTTHESEIQEVNPPKTVAPPPTASTVNWRKTYKVGNGSLYQYNKPHQSDLEISFPVKNYSKKKKKTVKNCIFSIIQKMLILASF